MNEGEIFTAITEYVTDHSDPEYPVSDMVLSPEKLAKFLAKHLFPTP